MDKTGIYGPRRVLFYTDNDMDMIRHYLEYGRCGVRVVLRYFTQTGGGVFAQCVELHFAPNHLPKVMCTLLGANHDMVLSAAILKFL